MASVAAIVPTVLTRAQSKRKASLEPSSGANDTTRARDALQLANKGKSSSQPLSTKAPIKRKVRPTRVASAPISPAVTCSNEAQVKSSDAGHNRTKAILKAKSTLELDTSYSEGSSSDDEEPGESDEDSITEDREPQESEEERTSHTDDGEERPKWFNGPMRKLRYSLWGIEEADIEDDFGPGVLRSRKSMNALVEFSKVRIPFKEARKRILKEKDERLLVSGSRGLDVCPRDIRHAAKKYEYYKTQSPRNNEEEENTSDGRLDHKTNHETLRQSKKRKRPLDSTQDTGNLPNVKKPRKSFQPSISAVDRNEQYSKPITAASSGKVGEQPEQEEHDQEEEREIEGLRAAQEAEMLDVSTSDSLVHDGLPDTFIANEQPSTLPESESEPYKQQHERAIPTASEDSTEPQPLHPLKPLPFTLATHAISARDSRPPTTSNIQPHINLGEKDSASSHEQDDVSAISPPNFDIVKEKESVKIDIDKSASQCANAKSASSLPLMDVQGALSTLQPQQWVSTSGIEKTLHHFTVIKKSKFRVLDGSYIPASNLISLSNKPPLQDRGATSFLFPLYLQEHWALGYIDSSIRKIHFYNSLRNVAQSEMVKIALQKVAADKLPALRRSTEDDPWEFKEEHCPQQSNYWDCGIYCIVFCIHLLAERPIPKTLDEASCRVWRSVAAACIDRTTQESLFDHDAAVKAVDYDAGLREVDVGMNDNILKRRIDNLQSCMMNADKIIVATQQARTVIGDFQMLPDVRQAEMESHITQLKGNLESMQFIPPNSVLEGTGSESDADIIAAQKLIQRWRTNKTVEIEKLLQAVKDHETSRNELTAIFDMLNRYEAHLKNERKKAYDKSRLFYDVEFKKAEQRRQDIQIKTEALRRELEGQMASSKQADAELEMQREIQRLLARMQDDGTVDVP